MEDRERAMVAAPWLSFLFSLLREGALNRDLRSPRVYTVIFERRGVCIYGGP